MAANGAGRDFMFHSPTSPTSASPTNVQDVLLVPDKCSYQSANCKGYRAFLIEQQFTDSTYVHTCALEFLISCRSYIRWYLVTVKRTNEHFLKSRLNYPTGQNTDYPPLLASNHEHYSVFLSVLKSF